MCVSLGMFVLPVSYGLEKVNAKIIAKLTFILQKWKNKNVLYKYFVFRTMEEGRMSVDSDEGEMIINEIDGLPNLHPNYNDFEFNQQTSRHGSRTIDDLIHDEDLPTSVIVTNLDSSIFKSDDLKVIY